MTGLPHFQLCFPAWKSKPLTTIVPSLAAMEADLLQHLVVYEPKKRRDGWWKAPSTPV